MDELTVRNNIINAINAFLAEHPMDDEVEFAAAVLCNLMLDLVGQTDEDFADELVGVVMENSRFDLDLGERVSEKDSLDLLREALEENGYEEVLE